MKKTLITFAAVLVAVATYAALTTGFGKELTASTTQSVVSGFTVASLSVYNTGSESVYALVNCSSNEFETALTAAETVPIPGGASFAFNTMHKTSIYNVRLATTNGTAAVVIAGY